MLFEDRVPYRDVWGPPERLPARWPRSHPSHIWIPARLLPDRCKRKNQNQKSAFHMLQRYESRDFEHSFSLYSDSESEEGEEYFHDYAEKEGVPPERDGSPVACDAPTDVGPYTNLVVALPDPGGRTEDGLLSSTSSESERSTSSEAPCRIEAEYAYHKRKPREDAVEEKTARKKGKRSKKRAAVTMPLGHFRQCIDAEGPPESDAFYESVMRERSGKDASYRHVGVNDVEEFPRLPLFPEGKRKKSELPRARTSPEREEALAPGREWNPEERIGGGVLVIANIPSDVDRDTVAALVSDYGQLLEMERVGESMTAEFWIPPEVELDWLVGCFDGHQPFGAYSSVLHCYEKES